MHGTSKKGGHPTNALSCAACFEQLEMEWDVNQKNPALQAKFQRPKGCVMHPIMGDLNDWQFIEVTAKAGQVNEEEVVELHQNVLTSLESKAVLEVKEDKFGVIDTAVDAQEAPDGFYLVQWKGLPFTLQEPTEVEGCDGGPMPAGTTVCKGVYYDRVTRYPGWYEPPVEFAHAPAEPKLFWMQMITLGNVLVSKANPAIKVGPPAEALNFHNMNKANQVVRVAVDQMTLIKVESKIREAMDRVLWQEEDGDEEDEAVENYVVVEDDDDDEEED